MSRILNPAPFHTLSKDNQNSLRREYRDKYREYYNYSILLFIIFSIFGILIILGMLLALIDAMLGILLAVLSLIGFVITTYFLYRSNDKFVRFLRKKGYRYE